MLRRMQGRASAVARACAGRPAAAKAAGSARAGLWCRRDRRGQPAKEVCEAVRLCRSTQSLLGVLMRPPNAAPEMQGSAAVAMSKHEALVHVC